MNFNTKYRQPRCLSGQTLPPMTGVPSSHQGLSMWVSWQTKQVWVVILGVSPVFPYNKFHSTISSQSSITFPLISSAPAMVRQAQSAGILVIHRPSIQGLHISSLDPILCQTRVEEIDLIDRFPVYRAKFVFQIFNQNKCKYVCRA